MIKNRYRRIVLFFANVFISFIFWELILPRFGLRNWAKRKRSHRLKRNAAKFRTLAVSMGGVLIKVGQFLSARADVIPPEITSELADLQDEVPPEKFADIRAIVEKEFGQKLEDVFIEFDENPMAAASLGQVHIAQLVSDDPITNNQNQSVVVKIQRPNIETIIDTDLAALKTVGNWLQHYKPISRRVDIPALLGEFTQILYEEIDYLAEGRNAEVFAENYQEDESIRIPKLIESHTTKRVLTLENVLAIKITDYDEITAIGIDRKEVAGRLLDVYLKQIFEDGVFHADPHPGNLFIRPISDQFDVGEESEVKWQLTFVDFGMVGRVPPEMIQSLREMLISVGTKDEKRLVRAYQKLGILLPGVDLDLLEKAEAKAFEHFWGKSMAEIQKMSPSEIHNFAAEFRELVYTMPFQVPHNFLLLVRAVGILSGMCTGLDNDFNVWHHLSPYAYKLIASEDDGPIETLIDEVKKWFLSMVATPTRISRLIEKLEAGEIEVRTPEISHNVSLLVTVIQQLIGGIVFSALLIGGIQLYLAEKENIALILIFCAAFSLFWIILLGLRRR